VRSTMPLLLHGSTAPSCAAPDPRCTAQRATPRPGYGPRLLVSALARASGGMADAHGSGPCVRKDVGVQLPPCPLKVVHESGPPTYTK
jgi:hypothetical protein